MLCVHFWFAPFFQNVSRLGDFFFVEDIPLCYKIERQ